MALHWEGLYTTVFTSGELIYEKTGLLKNEFVHQYFFSWHGYGDIFEWLIPLFLAAIFTWPLPQKVFIHLFTIEQSTKVDRKIKKLELEQRLLEEKKGVAEQKVDTLEAEVAAEEKKKAVARKDPAVIWKQEFEDLKAQADYAMFKQILQSVYEYDGNTYVNGGGRYFELRPQAKKMADVNGLITISAAGNKIALTEKGKYFAKLYDGPL